MIRYEQDLEMYVFSRMSNNMCPGDTKQDANPSGHRISGRFLVKLLRFYFSSCKPVVTGCKEAVRLVCTPCLPFPLSSLSLLLPPSLHPPLPHSKPTSSSSIWPTSATEVGGLILDMYGSTVYIWATSRFHINTILFHFHWILGVSVLCELWPELRIF